ncbi:thermonuclease family protein [Microcella frigidaquae]|uniref:Micrococcal nuclease n=1 Tax=Microcella frigidaquae TaxID=424758 RepID=A0A840XLX1_9MICO|nr:thermonuclease family protein [Microcella frigidaquae]MBB5617837.1 micrococcal nuclease [Microcella frigidaquae]NHN45838.1 thermonuclease family protein [Microcella frigidaquae]
MLSVLRPIARPLVVVGLIGLIGSVDGCLDSGTRGEAGYGPGDGFEGPTGVALDGTGTVAAITDGDTLRLEVEGQELRVRLIGVDTPEVYPDVECFGPEATDALTALAPPGSTLGYTYDRDERDQYDRELMYLFTQDGILINYELVAQGAGTAVLFEPNDRYWSDLQAAERAAQRDGLGLWGQC